MRSTMLSPSASACRDVRSTPTSRRRQCGWSCPLSQEQTFRQSKKGRQLPALPMPHYVLSLNQMRDLGEYLRAYVAYVSANLGWGKALRFVLVWLAGMFAPLAARTLVQLPEWGAMTWMVGWALLGYIFAPYGMWKHHRAQNASSIQPNQKQPR